VFAAWQSWSAARRHGSCAGGCLFCTAALRCRPQWGPASKLLGSFQCLVLCTSLMRSPCPTAQLTNFPPCVFQAVPSALAAAVLAAVIGVVIMA